MLAEQALLPTVLSPSLEALFFFKNQDYLNQEESTWFTAHIVHVSQGSFA